LRLDARDRHRFLHSLRKRFRLARPGRAAPSRAFASLVGARPSEVVARLGEIAIGEAAAAAEVP